MTKYKSSRGNITTDPTHIKRVIREHYEPLYANKFNKLNEIDKCHEKYNSPFLLSQEVGDLSM